MPTSAYNKFNSFNEDLVNGVHNFSTHVFKAMLSTVAPVATNTIKANLTEIAGTNGYTAGGHAVTMVVSRSTVTTKVTATDLTITATGGSITFRYVSIFNDTQTTPAKPLVSWFDYGAPVTVNDGESLTIDFDGTNGLFTIV